MSEKVAQIRVEGNLTALDAGALRRKIWDAIGSQRLECLVLDLSRTKYIDSSGLGVLVAAFKRLKEAGGTLKLYGLQPRVKTDLEATGLSKVIEIYEAPADEYAPARVALYKQPYKRINWHTQSFPL